MSAKSSDAAGAPAERAADKKSNRPALFVFHINDSTDDQVLFQAACSQAQVPFHWHVTDSAMKAISYFEALVKMSVNHTVRWPDLVVLDVEMPGDSGLKVLEYIRGTPQLRRMPVVIFTGHANKEMVDEAYRLGVNSFLVKPVDFSETVSLVGSLYASWSTAKRPQY